MADFPKSALVFLKFRKPAHSADQGALTLQTACRRRCPGDTKPRTSRRIVRGNGSNGSQSDRLKAAMLEGRSQKQYLGQFCRFRALARTPALAGNGPSAVAALATAMTTPGPKRSTVFTKPRSSIVEVLGDHLKHRSTPRSNGWTGSTIGDCSRQSAISRLPKPKNDTTPCRATHPWQHNLMRLASGNPGAVESDDAQYCHIHTSGVSKEGALA